MRAFVVAGLVIFHSAVVFSPGSSWFVTDPAPEVGFAAILVWGSLWGMPLLFAVSGMGARYALGTRSAGAFARERLARLLVPFITGLVLLVPPMFYLASLSQPDTWEPYWRFWASFLNVPAITAGLATHDSWTSGRSGFDPAHLWFLYVLLILTLVLLPLLTFLRGHRGTWMITGAARASLRHPLLAVVVAAVPVMALEAAFGPDVNTGGWERTAYAIPFVYGFMIASDLRFETSLARVRWATLSTALVATVALLAWPRSASFGEGVTGGWGALQGLAGWAWLAAILGFAASLTGRRRKRAALAGANSPRGERTQAVVRHVTEAVLPFYLLHEPVIVAVAWFAVRWQVPVPLKYAVLVLVSLSLTLALYELLIRPFGVPRFLFGMKGRPPA